MSHPAVRNLSIFFVASALGVGLAFSCSSTAGKLVGRAPASTEICDVPANKGLKKYHLRDPNYEYCAQFIDSNCKLGAFGETMRSWMAPTGLGAYVDAPPEDFATFCPNYAVFDREKRERFWVWTFMSLAYEESGCGEPSVVQAVRNYYEKYKNHPNPKLRAKVPADGPFALPYHTKDRDSRPEVCRDSSIVRDANLLVDPNFPGDAGPSKLDPSKIAGMTQSARCAMAILVVQLKKTNRLITKNTYWQMFKTTGPLTKRLAQFGGCTGKYEMVRPALPSNFGSHAFDTTDGN